MQYFVYSYIITYFKLISFFSLNRYLRQRLKVHRLSLFWQEEGMINTSRIRPTPLNIHVRRTNKNAVEYFFHGTNFIFNVHLYIQQLAITFPQNSYITLPKNYVKITFILAYLA